MPPCRPAAEIADFAVEVEAQGFDNLYVPDSQILWRDSYLTLFAAAMRTSTLGLGTAVSNVVTRHPSVVASLARTVAEAANGRFFLGLGVGNSSVEPVGLAASKQAELRHGIDTIRGLLSGSEVTFGDMRTRMHDPYGPVPIHVAASGPRNLRFAGEVADGAILLSGVSSELLSRAVSLIHEGATAADRDPADIDVVLSTYAMVTDDVERDARILKPICAGIAQNGGQAALAYAGLHIEVPARVPDVYPDLVHAEDWDHAVEVCSAWVSDADAVAFAKTFCLFGTSEEIVSKIDSAQKLGAKAVFLQHVGSYDLPEELVAAVGSSVLPALHSRNV